MCVCVCVCVRARAHTHSVCAGVLRALHVYFSLLFVMNTILLDVQAASDTLGLGLQVLMELPTWVFEIEI